MAETEVTKEELEEAIQWFNEEGSLFGQHPHYDKLWVLRDAAEHHLERLNVE